MSQSERSNKFGGASRKKQQRINGTLYQSMIEARWGAFLTAADISFQYNPGAIPLGELGDFFPSFFLPSERALLVCSGGKVEEVLAQLSRKTNLMVYLASLIPSVPAIGELNYPVLKAFDPKFGQADRGSKFRWSQCEKCRNKEIVLDGNPKFMTCKGGACKGSPGYGCNSALLRKAFIVSILFDHTDEDVTVSKVEDNGAYPRRNP